MKIQQYAAQIKASNTVVIGYICEIREHIGAGCYSEEIDYLMSVNVHSMPNNPECWGSWLVEKDSIVTYN